ncbi:MAG: biopolymer transporter ExbD [Xanthomonadales bacterium]|nr:biopolymer transporter ExbD [Xanthomonadales bacterium]
MKLQHHTLEDPTVDLTSLIDVVFLLLLFFMVSTTFEHTALLKVDLPEASAVDDREAVPESLELVIDDEGRMYLNDQRLVDSEAQTIRAAIEQAVGDARTLPLVLRADRMTPHHQWSRRWTSRRRWASAIFPSPRTGRADRTRERSARRPR